MKVLVFSSLLVVALAAQVSCSSKKNAVTPEVTEQSSSSDKVKSSDSLFASLERGVCFGKCPVFNLKIYQSGYAVYEGKSNTEMIGIYETRFTKAQLNELTDVAKRINYMSLNDVYDNPGVTDLPSHTSSIVIDGKRKQVTRRHGYPETIVVFEKQMESMVAEATWNPKK